MQPPSQKFFAPANNLSALAQYTLYTHFLSVRVLFRTGMEDPEDSNDKCQPIDRCMASGR